MTTRTKQVVLRVDGRVVEMTRAGLRMREKGRQTWLGPMSWGSLYIELATREADARIAARRAARRRRR